MILEEISVASLSAGGGRFFLGDDCSLVAKWVKLILLPPTSMATNNIVTVNITDKLYTEAEQRNQKYYDKFGQSGTHRTNKHRQRMTGYLAEACIKNTFPALQYSDNLAVDFIYEGASLDSKAQGCNSKPLVTYAATLYAEQKNRDADYYIFSRVKNDFTKCWICGIISKPKFFKIAQLKPAGNITNNFIYDQSRYEIEYKDLRGVDEFIAWHEKSLLCH
jgi:hypothetical protein